MTKIHVRRPLHRATLCTLTVAAAVTLVAAPASASPFDDVLGGLDLGSSRLAAPTAPPDSAAGFTYPVTFSYTGTVPIASAEFEFGYTGGGVSCVSLSTDGYVEQQNAFPADRTATLVFRKSGSCSVSVASFRLTLRPEGSRDRYTGNFQVVMYAPSAGTGTTTALTRCTEEPDLIRPGYTGIRMGCSAYGARGADTATVVYS